MPHTSQGCNVFQRRWMIPRCPGRIVLRIPSQIQSARQNRHAHLRERTCSILETALVLPDCVQPNPSQMRLDLVLLASHQKVSTPQMICMLGNHIRGGTICSIRLSSHASMSTRSNRAKIICKLHGIDILGIIPTIYPHVNMVLICCTLVRSQIAALQESPSEKAPTLN